MAENEQQLNTGTGIEDYNRFCGNLHEGYVLYNIDSTNSWGDYLLVANIAKVVLGEHKTYTVMLLGLRKEGSRFLPRNTRIKLTPEYARNIPFLKYVGKCSYSLVPDLSNVEVNIGLAAVYGETDLRKYARKLSVRKPKRKGYWNDGRRIVRDKKD